MRKLLAMEKIFAKYEEMASVCSAVVMRCAAAKDVMRKLVAVEKIFAK